MHRGPLPAIFVLRLCVICDEQRSTALRRSEAYQRFPELLLEHPNRAENAFRTLLLSGIALRDADEWEKHHMASVSLTGAGDGGGVDWGDGVFAGLGGKACRLAEIDGSVVAIVEVMYICVICDFVLFLMS